MSELFMECEEEELEPWQRRIPEINLVDDDDDDEPIFVGEICSSKVSMNPRPSAGPILKAVSTPNQQGTPPSSVRRAVPVSPGTRVVSGTMTNPHRPLQTSSNTQSVSSGPSQLTIRTAPPPPVTKSLIIPVTSQAASLPVVAQNVSHTITAVTPQPIIINNQGYILTTHETPNNSTVIASLGSQYSSGTSFTVIPAGQQVLPQVTTARAVSGVVHRPQVQLVQNNVVTLANTQSPSQHKQPSAQFVSNDMQPVHMSPTMLHPLQVGSSALQSKAVISTRQQSSPQPLSVLHTVATTGNNTSAVKRDFPLDSVSPGKKTKLESVIPSSDIPDNTQNGMPFRQKCPKCNIQFNLPDPMKSHMRYCCYHLMHTIFPSTPTSDKTSSPAQDWQAKKGKLIMLVTEFYYGRHEGDGVKEQKTNTTFKCSSCLKVLKNNIRFMNHMKHHLELEKQSNESWESHTTCQHCYRQYATPFQLQCHIESAHSPYESTTICKICELAFETEQALLEHMKASHKPGEMPYVCQVCNYRSSFFSEVESHFRSMHENTKDLLCPFCLKVLRSGHMYMQHYMKHQNKGIHRCGKCRLNFLTQKEKMNHKIQFHRTFKKPKILEGLPPGTKVTIRASFSGGSPSSPSSPTSPSSSAISVISSSPPTKRPGRPSLGTAKSKSPAQSSGTGKPRSHSRRQDRHQHLQDKSNHILKTLRNEFGVQTCIECSSKISDFYMHFPAMMSCGACKYRTSCSKSFGNHMIRFHSAVSWDRLRKMRKPQNNMRSMTLVCLNCDFLEDAAGSDLMSKHLVDRPHHTCQVIIEKEVYSSVPTDIQHQSEVPAGVGTAETEGGKHKSRFCGRLDSSSDAERTKKDGSAPDGHNKFQVSEACSGSEAPRKQEKDAGEVKTSKGRGQTKAAEQSARQVLPPGTSPTELPQADKEICEEPTELGSLDNWGTNGEGSVIPGEGVLFEEFLRRVDKSESTDANGSKRGNVLLEPLTPSKVLEHEATEILQKGSTSPSESNGGAASGWDCSRPSTPELPKTTN